jgi:DeoR/GlpR family transcriptional regulator of sugar metabolism
VPGGELGRAVVDAIGSKPVRVVTCSIDVAMLLAPRPNVCLGFAGGTVQEGSYEVAGDTTRAGLQGLNLGAVLIHAEGLTRSGAFAHDPRAAAATRCLVERARGVVAVAEAEACGVPSDAVICGLDDLDWVVTDRAADPAPLAELQRLGVLVTAL